MEQICWGLESLARPLGELRVLGAAVCACLYVGNKSVFSKVSKLHHTSNVGIKPLSTHFPYTCSD